MDTIDFTNQIEIENEQEEFEEQKRMDEEDRGLDNLKRNKGLTEEQLYNFRQQNIKSLYAQLYKLGLDGKTSQVRSKLQALSEFFGEFGSIDRLSNEQLGIIDHLLNYLRITGYKF